MKVAFLTYCFIFCFAFLSLAQLDELESLLENEMSDRVDYTTATFKSTRIISGHSVEKMKKHEFDFRISHRFGTINKGWYDAFGLDQASTSYRLDYGLTDFIMIGIGRSTYKKTFDGFVKITALKQKTGSSNFPMTISYVTGCFLNTIKWTDPERTNYFFSRMMYVHQVLMARKITNNFSIQISPTIVHRNLVPNNDVPADIYSLGLAGRFKISKRVAICAEYFPVFNDRQYEQIPYCNSFSVGLDIETGGHVFQLHLTNSMAMIENGFISETTGSWKNGDIHFGFNISRVFTPKFKQK